MFSSRLVFSVQDIEYPGFQRLLMRACLEKLLREIEEWFCGAAVY